MLVRRVVGITLFSFLAVGLLAQEGGSKKADDSKAAAAGQPSASQGTDPLNRPLTAEQKKQAKKLLKELEGPYKKWLAQDVVYIITDEEKNAFVRLSNNEERDQFIEQFWMRRDPTPDTVENEYKEEHYRRIAYANEHFTAGIPGWKTDRGRIYIIYGPADEIESHPSGGQYQRPPKEGGGTTSTFPFEQWLYRHIDGIGYNVIIEFVDRTRSGQFRQTLDPHEKEILSAVPGSSRFYSTNPGAFVTVDVTPERRMVATVPIDFEAPQYSVQMKARTSTGQTAFVLESSPKGVLAVRPIVVERQLAPGAYVFDVTVTGGGTQKTYTVNFIVK